MLDYERQMAALHAASLAVPATEATRVATPSPAAVAPEEERPALPSGGGLHFGLPTKSREDPAIATYSCTLLPCTRDFAGLASLTPSRT